MIKGYLGHGAARRCVTVDRGHRLPALSGAVVQKSGWLRFGAAQLSGNHIAVIEGSRAEGLQVCRNSAEGIGFVFEASDEDPGHGFYFLPGAIRAGGPGVIIHWPSWPRRALQG